MVTPILHASAVVLCAHGGRATPTTASARVRVAGQSVATLADPYIVAGCPLAPPDQNPCVTARFVVGAARVRVGGAPVLLADSPAVCAPNGTPVTVVTTQSRVTAI
jgi:uncharacterized Zn-binding protein involved in type VI secretion